MTLLFPHQDKMVLPQNPTGDAVLVRPLRDLKLNRSGARWNLGVILFTHNIRHTKSTRTGYYMFSPDQESIR